MRFFYAVNGKFLKEVTFILVIAFFTAWIFSVQSMVSLPVFLTKEGPKAVYKGERDIALTFNIGWGDEKAAPILEQLKAQNVKAATFFLSGSWAERHPDLVAAISKQGYEIGMLGYGYVDYTEVEDAKIRRDLLKAQDVFKKLNIKEVKLVRAPTGHFDKRALKIAQNYGYTIVHWSVDSKDWTNPGIDRIVANVGKADDGDIVLLHASDAAKQTAKALPSILTDLNTKNLKFLTVSEMIANGVSRSEEVR